MSHWGAGYGADAVQDADPSHRSRYARMTIESQRPLKPQLPAAPPPFGAPPSPRSLLGRYGDLSSPIIEFHGDKDPAVPYADALKVEAAYQQANSSGRLFYEMHLLKGCAHAAWCAGCGAQCTCAQGTWCDAQDTTALPFVVRYLDLELRAGASVAAAPFDANMSSKLVDTSKSSSQTHTAASVAL